MAVKYDAMRLTAGNAVDGGKLTDTEGREQDTHGTGLDAGVAIGGVRGVELVAGENERKGGSREDARLPVTNPVDVGVVLDKVEEAEVEVSRKTEHVLMR